MKIYIRLIVIFIAIFSMCSLIGCATKKGLYADWAQKLNAPGPSQDDVSLMLGSPPTKCENIEAYPTIGFSTDTDNKILSVLPKSCAATAGMRKGDKVLKVNNISVSNREELMNTLKPLTKWDEPINISTKTKTYTLIPTRPNEAYQCYWDVSAGSVAKSSRSTYVYKSAGAAGSKSAQYERFFKTSCRFYDGYSLGCASNWQQ